MATERVTHNHRTIAASSILHLLFALNLLTNQSPASDSIFLCSPTLSLTFQLPAALSTPLGVSLFTFHSLYSARLSHTSAKISTHSLAPLWLPGANISDKSERAYPP